MARQVITQLIDDVDGGKADETVSFALDGTVYTIDLSEKNAGKLRDAFAKYLAAGTRVGRTQAVSKGYASTGTRRGTGVDNKAVREWAAANKIELAARGRIPQEVIDKYNSR